MCAMCTGLSKRYGLTLVDNFVSQQYSRSLLAQSPAACANLPKGSLAGLTLYDVLLDVVCIRHPKTLS